MLDCRHRICLWHYSPAQMQHQCLTCGVTLAVRLGSERSIMSGSSRASITSTPEWRVRRRCGAPPAVCPSLISAGMTRKRHAKLTVETTMRHRDYSLGLVMMSQMSREQTLSVRATTKWAKCNTNRCVEGLLQRKHLTQ